MVPSEVLAAYFGVPATVVDEAAESIGGSSGAATASITRVTGHSDRGPFCLIRKRFRPITAGRHAAAAADPRHWAYWRREVLAYQSGLLPTGPAIRAPRCYGVVGDTVYLEHVDRHPIDPHTAAYHLGRWQAAAGVPVVPWAGGHQLAQRVAVSDLDWTTVDLDPVLPRIWARRYDMLADLDGLPLAATHGDFHIGNISAPHTDGEPPVVFDWSTYAAAPIGADAAHLALSTLTDVEDAYRLGLSTADGRPDTSLAPFARRTYQVTIALVGASRTHWMATNGIPIPDGYVDFTLRFADRYL